MTVQQPLTLFDFGQSDDLSDWYILDDTVMGGRSAGQMGITAVGHAVFEGTVSLENNGGFSSVRYRPEAISVMGYSQCVFRIKGDGKRYQFRIKAEPNQDYSYISYFETSGDWEIISMPIHDMYPQWRGRKLNLPNYSGELLSEISFLVGNKKAETFRLELDWMRME